MSTQNITLSIPKETLLKAKILAIRRGTSISGLLAAELERLVNEDETYERAKHSALMRLDQSYDLSTKGRITIDRDEPHSTG